MTILASARLSVLMFFFPHQKTQVTRKQNQPILNEFCFVVFETLRGKDDSARVRGWGMTSGTSDLGGVLYSPLGGPTNTFRYSSKLVVGVGAGPL